MQRDLFGTEVFSLTGGERIGSARKRSVRPRETLALARFNGTIVSIAESPTFAPDELAIDPSGWVSVQFARARSPADRANVNRLRAASPKETSIFPMTRSPLPRNSGLRLIFYAALLIPVGVVERDELVNRSQFAATSSRQRRGSTVIASNKPRSRGYASIF